MLNNIFAHLCKQKLCKSFQETGDRTYLVQKSELYWVEILLCCGFDIMNETKAGKGLFVIEPETATYMLQVFHRFIEHL